MSAMGPILLILYARVSTEDQGRAGYSLPEQLRACRAKAAELAAASNSAVSIVEFQDEMSGDLLERPKLQAALELIRRQKVGAFICFDPDRLARKLMHQLLLADEIEARSQLVFVQHDYSSEPEGQLFFQIRGAVAQFEKAKILERTTRGARGKIAMGGLPHIIRLYGYRFRAGAGKVKANQVLLPDPIEAAWVQTMFRWCAEEGMGPQAISVRLNELGVPTKLKGLWAHVQTRRILRNATYATGRLALGTRDHRGIAVARQLPADERVKRGLKLVAKRKPESDWQYVSIEPIVPVDLWKRAQEVLDGFRVGGRADNHPGRIRMLTGLGRCGLCGGPLYYLNGTKMVCANRYRHHSHPNEAPSSCTLPAKPRVKVEAAVWAQVRTWLSHPDLLQQAADEARAASTPAIPNADQILSEISVVETQIQAKAEEQERVGLLFARNLWPADKALPALEKIGAELQALRQRFLALQQRAPAPPQGAKSPLLSLLTDPAWQVDVRATLDNLSDDQRLELVRLAVGSFVMNPTGRGQEPSLQVHLRLV